MVNSLTFGSKPATDLAYNTGISTIISALDAQLAKRPELALSVVFGTHNPESVSRVINELRAHGLAKDMGSGRLTLREDVRGKVFIAQLYGKSIRTIPFHPIITVQSSNQIFDFQKGEEYLEVGSNHD